MMTIREKARRCSYLVFFVLFILGITIFIKLIPRDNPELTVDYDEKISIYIPSSVKLVDKFSFANSITVEMKEYKKIPTEEKFMTISIVSEWIKVDYYSIAVQGGIPFAFTASEKFPVPTRKKMKWGHFGWQGRYFFEINEGKIYLPMRYFPFCEEIFFIWLIFPISILYWSIQGAVWARKHLIKNRFFGRYDEFGIRIV